MDVFAHAFWAGASATIARRKVKGKLRVAWFVLWGIFPDLFAFGPAFLLSLWLRVSGNPAGTASWWGRGLRELLPSFLQPQNLYLLSHSLVIFGCVLGAVWLLRRKVAYAMFGWPLHILLDIPTHRAGRFGTPFAWPLSDYRFDGISWGQRWFMVLNYTAILATYIAIFVWLWLEKRNRQRLAPIPKPELHPAEAEPPTKVH